MSTKTNKAIILLNPPYNAASHELTRDIIKSCKNNNLAIIKIIQCKSPYDSSAFYKLITKVAKSSDKPVTIIIDNDFHYLPLNLLAVCILGTLSAADLITVSYYEKAYSPCSTYLGIKLQTLTKGETAFLFEAAQCFKRIVSFIAGKTN